MTNQTSSALYVGEVMHRRLRPRVHQLRYRLFSLLLDLDEIDVLAARLRLFSRGRFNVFGFSDADHLDGSATPLRAQIAARMAQAGIAWDGNQGDGGPVRVLTMPRVLGFAFNPISVWFIHHRSGALAAMLYEVNNTFGERHEYLLPVAIQDADKTSIRQSIPKAFHVSPFMGMDMDYHFRITPPRKDRATGRVADRLGVAISGSDAQGLLIVAVHCATRRALNDAALARVFVTHPLLTVKVVGGILWEAAKLWVKRVPVHDHPAPPIDSLSTLR